MGAFVYALLMAQGLNLDPAVYLEIAGRIIRDADSFYTPEVRAARDYIENELKGK